MKILVFDDNKINRDAAQAQLADHELTVVGTYSEAQDLLIPKIDWDLYHQKLSPFKEKFADFDPQADNADQAKLKEYEDGIRVIREQSTRYPDFDVVLTDLLVPASKQSQGDNGWKFVGQEMPIGIFIGLLAAVKGRVKYIAVFTDINHHNHPASACLDAFGSGPFMVQGSKIILLNKEGLVNYFELADLTKEVDLWEGKPSNLSFNEVVAEAMATGKIARAKNWAAALDYLLKCKADDNS